MNAPGGNKKTSEASNFEMATPHSQVIERCRNKTEATKEVEGFKHQTGRLKELDFEVKDLGKIGKSSRRIRNERKSKIKNKEKTLNFRKGTVS